MQESISSQIESIASKSKTDDIYIIGKGPSLDSIDCAALPPGVVINLNDSERISPGDFAVFSANWVRHSLNEEGFRAGFYLAGKPLPSFVPHTLLPPIPLELDQEDFTTIRLNDPTFYDESFVLLNAFKLSLRLQELRQRPQTVYLLGFDFSTSAGSVSRRIYDHSGATTEERNAVVASQEHAFRQFLHYFEGGDRLRLRHVGSKEYSAVSLVEFSRTMHGNVARPLARPFNLADPDRVLIVAELTNNHLGDADRLVEMVQRAHEAGADLIKVQKRDVDTFYTAEQLASYYWSPFGETLGAYRRGVELNVELIELLDATCQKLQIEWFCSVLDYPSYEFIQQFNPRLLKIPSTISNHREYHEQFARTYHGAVVISTGYTEQEYIDFVLETYRRNEIIYLLHCVSAYPTPQSACNVAVVGSYRQLASVDPRIIPGYSSHDLGSTGCMLAVAAGARMLEKHVKLGNVDWVHFDRVAIDLASDEFYSFVRDVRLAEEMIGNAEKRVLDCENHKYSVMLSPNMDTRTST